LVSSYLRLKKIELIQRVHKIKWCQGALNLNLSQTQKKKKKKLKK